MNAFLALVRKDLKLFFSNRRALIVTVVTPIAIAAFFGSLFGNSTTKHAAVPVAIVDLDQSPVSTAFVAALGADASLAVEKSGESAAIESVRAGKRPAALVLPAGFGNAAIAAFHGGSVKPALVLHTDPSQAMATGLVRGIATQHAMKAVAMQALGAGGPAAPMFEPAFRMDVREAAGDDARRKYNPYSHAFGGMSVQFLMFAGIELGVGLLLMRRMGLWTRMRVAPLSRTVLLGSTVVSGSIIGAVVMLLIFTAGMLAFGVRIEGSVAGFLGVAASFVILSASFGLLLAALGNDPDVTRGLAIFATLLMVMLGGAWVPSFAFPEWMQQVTRFVPTRWAVDGLASMTWRGLGFDAAVRPMVQMLALAVAMFLLSIWRFRWEE